MSFKSFGLRVVGKTRIKTEKVHFQYLAPVFNEKFWPNSSMSLSNSPHVRFLKKYQKAGMNIDKLWNTDYVKLMEYWNSIGFHKRDKKFIINKMRRFIRLYESIKKRKFKDKHRIQVLKKPFWITRYGGEERFLKGYELWHGHHRASCCYALGVNRIPCVILEDKKPGSMKCSRIDKRLNGIRSK